MSKATTTDKILDKLMDVNNILVTVNKNPSVDELSTALGLTLLFNKMEKHATAVFSGDTPPVLDFLKPEKTFEDSTDSLRDFIIALNKEKADHLRYKLVDEYVKIFITPYKTKITNDDLEFSHGDYNVEMVFAVGVENEEDLDAALSDHGRIMHDATVVAMSIGREESTLGTMNWHQDLASSYAEMAVDLATKIKKDKNLLDEQVSTALLTGIVAATDRFSNDRTSSDTMKLAAQLMAAGANQQLIASKIGVKEAATVASASSEPEKPAAKKDADIDEILARQAKKQKKPQPAPEPKDPTKLSINHTYVGDLDEVDRQVKEERSQQAIEKAESQLKHIQESRKQGGQESPAPVEKKVTQLPTIPPAPAPAPQKAPELDRNEMEKPQVGGTLNATTSLAEEEKRRLAESDRNKVILSHDKPGAAPQPDAMNAYAETISNSQQDKVTLEQLDQKHRGSKSDDARAAIHAALAGSGAGAAAAATPVHDAYSIPDEHKEDTGHSAHGLDIQPLDAPAGPMPSPQVPMGAPEGMLPPLSPSGPSPQAPPMGAPMGGEPMPQQPMSAAPQPAGMQIPPMGPAPQPSGLPPMPNGPVLPPMPDMSSLPPMPGGPVDPGQLPTMPLSPPPQGPHDPAQFRIPGQ